MSDEPAPYGRYLYLGMLQVHGSISARCGSGHGSCGGGQGKIVIVCALVKTIPETEACEFYEVRV